MAKKVKSDEPFSRIELQAPPDWVAELDSVAEAMGLSRSAYIRLACNTRMAADRRMLGIDRDDSRSDSHN